ncbi:hypothetical protein N9L68_03650 [bacterium]|nr:hypothetical protein [bacterium]
MQKQAPRGCWRRGPDGHVAVEHAQDHTARDCTQRFSRMRHAHWPDDSFADIAGSWRVADQRLRQGDSVDVASISCGTRSGSHALWEASGINEYGRGELHAWRFCNPFAWMWYMSTLSPCLAKSCGDAFCQANP